MAVPTAGRDSVHTRSSDGTAIAFDRLGDGPSVILVGGALNDRSTFARLAAFLEPRFTVFNYDRRGRGDSGDTQPYAVDREVEDLEALLAVAGGSAAVFANCSGGMLVVEAAATGLPLTRIALYEPPYIVDDTRPPVAKDYLKQLTGLISAGRNGDAAELFMTEVTETPVEVIEAKRKERMWSWIEGLAPSLAYDGTIMKDNSLPLGLLGAVSVPTLVIDGEDSPPWARNGVQAVVDALPKGRRRSLEGQNHKLSAEVVAPVLAEFFTG